MSGPPAWELGEVLRNTHCKNVSRYVSLKQKPRTWTDTVIGLSKEKRQVGRGGMEWIQLAQDKDMWRALVNVVMNIRVP
jgi:hypothetical protein